MNQPFAPNALMAEPIAPSALRDPIKLALVKAGTAIATLAGDRCATKLPIDSRPFENPQHIAMALLYATREAYAVIVRDARSNTNSADDRDNMLDLLGSFDELIRDTLTTFDLAIGQRDQERMDNGQFGVGA